MATLIPTVQTLPARVTLGTLLADAGYDSERNHVYARDYKKIRTIIPAKAGRKTSRPPKTKYRRKMKQQFNQKLYGQRAQVETVFSMIKRRWGSAVRAHRHMAQQQELWLMVLTHNLAIFWLIWELFYRAIQTQFPDRVGEMIRNNLIYEKFTKIMQNEPNFKIGRMYVRLAITKSYEDFYAFDHQKNKPTKKILKYYSQATSTN